MKTKMMKRSGWLLGIALMIALAAMVLTAAEHEKKMSGKENTAEDIQKKCMMHCQKCCEEVDAMMSSLNEAIKAIDAGNTDIAKTKIAAVKTKLENMKDKMKECMKDMPACNMVCPITGEKIDMKDVPEDQMRVYHGMKVGFCCPACPPKWDKMSDEEKTEKLKKCMQKKDEMMKFDMNMHKNEDFQ